jgi:hypothetical protein
MGKFHLLGYSCMLARIAVATEFPERCNQNNGPLTANGVAVYASTLDSNFEQDLEVKLMTCGPDNELFDTNNAGVFYSVDGTDARMLVSSCSEQADFRNRVSVFSTCDSGTCLNSATENKESNVTSFTCPHANASFIEFQSTAGETYSIFVQDEHAGESGNFWLDLEEIQPENGSCQTALELEMDETVVGTTAGANIVAVEPCNGTSPDGPGTWFRIPAEDDDGDDSGDEQLVFVACSRQQFNFLVYSDGGCDGLTCAETETQTDEEKFCEDGSTQSRVSWIATKAEAYYVHMYAEEGAQFRLAFARLGARNDQDDISGEIIRTVNFGWILALFLWMQL